MGVMHVLVSGCQRTCCVLAMMMYTTRMGKVPSENPEGETIKREKVVPSCEACLLCQGVLLAFGKQRPRSGNERIRYVFWTEN